MGLEIDECPLKVLKALARSESIEGFYQMKSKQLKAVLTPIMNHKKHKNKYQAVDMEKCEFCKSGKAIAYDKKQEELDNNPVVIKNRLFNSMYRQTMSNHINESAVIKQFGLSKDDLERAIIAQKVHWQTRSFYGNSCTRYEYNDIVKYVKELEEEEETATNSNSNTNTNQKRKFDDAMDDENVMK